MAADRSEAPVPHIVEANQTDYAGAVYGSLLAASVVAGSAPRVDPPRPAELVVLLLATGIVFWLAHNFADIVGDRAAGAAVTWAEVRSVATREWPIVQAAVPPALTAAVAAIAGVSDSGVAWVALIVALAGQVGWAVVAAAKTGASRSFIVVSGIVNLVLGMIIVLLKTMLTH